MKKSFLILAALFIVTMSYASFDKVEVSVNGITIEQTDDTRVDFPSNVSSTFTITADVTIYKRNATEILGIANSEVFLTSGPNMYLYSILSNTGTVYPSTTKSTTAEGYYLYAYAFVTSGSTGVALANATVRW